MPTQKGFVEKRLRMELMCEEIDFGQTNHHHSKSKGISRALAFINVDRESGYYFFAIKYNVI